MQKTRCFSPGCDFCCEFCSDFSTTFVATLLPFVLRAQVPYHVLIKMAGSENEDNIMYLLLLTSSCMEKIEFNM